MTSNTKQSFQFLDIFLDGKEIIYLFKYQIDQLSKEQNVIMKSVYQHLLKCYHQFDELYMDFRPNRIRKRVQFNSAHDDFFKNIFGSQSSSEDNDYQLPQMTAKKKRQFYFPKNLREYPFCRKHHSEVDISRLQRVNYSYARYDDGQTYKEHRCLNRYYVGLPPATQQHKNKDKNICHVKLFQIQDQKLRIDRKIIKLQSNLSKDPDNKDVLVELQLLKMNKLKKQKQWLAMDTIFYYSSLDQLYWDAQQQEQSYISKITLQPWTQQIKAKRTIWDYDYYINFVNIHLTVIETMPQQLNNGLYKSDKKLSKVKWQGNLIPFAIFDFRDKQAIKLTFDVINCYSLKLLSSSQFMNNIVRVFDWILNIKIDRQPRLTTGQIIWGQQMQYPQRDDILIPQKLINIKLIDESIIQLINSVYKIYQRVQYLIKKGFIHGSNYSQFLYHSTRHNIHYTQRNLFQKLGSRRYSMCNWSRYLEQVCKLQNNIKYQSKYELSCMDGVVYIISTQQEWLNVQQQIQKD